MTAAVLRAMWLALWRDRGALVMSFVVPVVFFIVFAEVFASAAGGELRLTLALVDEVQDDDSARLAAALSADPALRPLPDVETRDAARSLVRRGTADVGLVIRADGEPLRTATGLGTPPLLLLVDPSRAVTATILTGQLQRAYLAALPDVALGNVVEIVENEFTEFTDEQRREIGIGLDELRTSDDGTAQAGWTIEDLVDREDVAGQTAALNHVAYYAGAIAFLFLLLSASQGAMSLFDEQDAGILERIVAGPAGIGVVINGKFLYLVLLGLLQNTVIFTVAWLVYGVDVPARPGSWLLVAGASALAAAGLGLALVTLCHTRAQAQILPTITILVLSAVGGSMVPRFFMPDWLKDLGWLTPNTWVLEAYSGLFWRGESTLQLLPLCIIMGATGLLGLLASRWFGRRLVSE